jgi:hypothetical protein
VYLTTLRLGRRRTEVAVWLNGLRCTVQAIFLFGGVVATCEAKEAVRVPIAEVQSFANSPLPVSVRVVKRQTGVRLLLDAQFTNSCLADAGVSVKFADLLTPTVPRTRILVLQQRHPPEGCPDIYQPAMRAIAVDIKESAQVEQVALLDGSMTPEPRLISLEPNGRVETSAAVTDIEPLFATQILPDLAHRGASTFDVEVPASCGPKDLLIQVREGRTAIEGQPVTSIPLWLLVGFAKPDCGREAPDPRSFTFEIPTGDLVLNGRVLILVNSLTRGPDAPALPFQRLDQ